MPTSDHLWDEHEAARYLQVSNHAIRRWKADGKIGFVKLGHLVRYDPKEIRAFAERSRHHPTCGCCGKPVHQDPPALPEDVDPHEPRFAGDKAS